MAADKDRGHGTADLRAEAGARADRGTGTDRGTPERAGRNAGDQYVDDRYVADQHVDVDDPPVGDPGRHGAPADQPDAEPLHAQDPDPEDPTPQEPRTQDPPAQDPPAERRPRPAKQYRNAGDRLPVRAGTKAHVPMRVIPAADKHGGSRSSAAALIEAPPRTWHRRWMRRATVCVGSVIAVAVLAAGGLWLLLANGPVSIDVATPWIADAVAGNLGNGYHVDIGDTVLENDERGRPAMRIRAITVRDHDGTVVASAPKAEVGFSGASLLSGHPRAQRLNLVGAELAIKVEADGRITMSTGSGDPPLAVAPPPAADKRTAPLADGVTALTAGGAEAPRGVAEILAAFLTWVDSLHGLDGGDLTEVGLKSGNLVVDDHRNGQQSRFENIHLILSRPAAGAVEFELGSDDPAHPWLLLAAIRPGRDGDRILDLDAREVHLRDVLLAARVDGGQIDTDVAMSARVRAELSGDGNPRSASGRIELGAGAFTDTGDPRATLAIDSAQASFDWNAGERLLTLPFEIRSGRTRLLLTAQAQSPKTGDGSNWTLNLANTAPAVLAPASKGEQPLVLNRVVLQGGVDLSSRRFTIEHADVTGKGVAITISGSLDCATSDPRLKVQVTGHKLPLSAFKAVWPPLITPPVREWIAERTSGGMIEDAEITTDALISTLRSSGPPVPPEGLQILVRTTGATVQAFDNLPPFHDVDIVSRTRGQSVAVTFNHGNLEMPQGRRLTLTSGSFDVADTSVKNPPARAQAKIEGPVPAAADLLSMDRLKDAAGVVIDPATSRGNINASVNLALRLGQDITAANLGYGITADVTGFSADHFVMSQKVEAQVLHVTANNQAGAQIKGDVRIGGAPATVELHRGPDENDADVRLTSTLDDTGRTRLGLDPGNAITGPIAIKMAGRIGVSGDTESRLAVDADFTQAKVDGLLPGWTKAARVPAKATFTYVGRGKPERIEDVAFEGNGAVVRGNMEFNANGEFSAGSFPTFGLSEGDRANLAVERTPDGVYRVTLHGDTFDGRNFIRGSLSGGTDPKRRHTPVDIDLDLRVGAIAGGMGEILRNADVHLARRGGTIRAFSGNARFAGEGVLQGDLHGNPPLMYVETNDAGALFRFSNTYSRMNGGKMFIAMDPPGSDGDKVGRIDVRDFTIRGEQALDNLAARAPNGANYGVPFTHMKADFARSPGRLTIRNGVAAGPIAGGTIDGVMNYADNQLNLSGAFVPLYGLNAALADAPLVGPIFGGNKGFIGSVSYEVAGSPGAPILKINPISAVAPGFTKEILDALKPVR